MKPNGIQLYYENAPSYGAYIVVALMYLGPTCPSSICKKGIPAEGGVSFDFVGYLSAIPAL